MGEKNGKGTQAQVQRASQGCDSDYAAIGNFQAGFNGSGYGVEGTVRIDYQDWVRRNPPIGGDGTGGIIAQLIEEAEDQLGDAQECIARVQKEVKSCTVD